MKKLTDTIIGRFLQVFYIASYVIAFGIIGLLAYSDYNSVQSAKKENENIEIVKTQPGYEDFVKKLITENEHPVTSEIVQKIEIKYNLDLPYDFKPNINTTFNVSGYLFAGAIVIVMFELVAFVILYIFGINAMTLTKILIKKS